MTGATHRFVHLEIEREDRQAGVFGKRERQTHTGRGVFLYISLAFDSCGCLDV
jgi:hypothetical protein